MSEKNEEEKTSTKVNSFLEKNRKGIVICFVAVIVALAAFLVYELVNVKVTNKTLSEIDVIFYQMTDGSASLESSELEAKRAEFIEKLSPYTKKGGAAGIRANMICAELSFQKADYEAAVSYWTQVVNKGKKAYTASLANYNLGVCYEQLGKTEEAAASYKAAADDEDYVMKNHAMFSYGRVLETSGKYAEAVEVYTNLDNSSPDDSWAQLARTRIIALTVENKIQ